MTKPTTDGGSFELHNPKSQALLDAGDLFAQPSGDGYAFIRDEDGRLLVCVPVDIEPAVLSSVLSYGSNQFARGFSLGRSDVKRELLALIGAQSATEKA